MNGVLLIDKPAGMTSHDVVDRIRKVFATQKVGHLGTLDPIATGVVPVCLGKATKLARFLSGPPKEYVGELRLGFATTTYDREGRPLAEEARFEGTENDVERAMLALTGTLRQAPPPFSAKKVSGVASYRLARKGRPAELKPVRVNVERFELQKFQPPTVGFRVVCSPGTYVRSLVHDLGQSLGCGAHLVSLRRTRSGAFRLEEAVPLATVTATDLVPMERLLEDWPKVEVRGEAEEKVRHGNRVQAEVEAPFVRIFNERKQLLAVGSVENGWVSPKVVLT